MLSKNDHINELTDHTRSKVIKCFKFEVAATQQTNEQANIFKFTL
jgi:hypothetical protein